MIDFLKITMFCDRGCGGGCNPCGNNNGCGVKRIYINTLTGITGPTGATEQVP